MKLDIQQWEGEGGAVGQGALPSPVALHGSESQVEWAERIRRAVNAEFDRVARALRSATSTQSPENRGDVRTVITILEDKRAEVMAIDLAWYFVREWQKMDGRVRRMVNSDSRYARLRATRESRRPPLVRDSAGD